MNTYQLPSSTHEYECIQLDELRAGLRLSHAVYGEGNVKLIGANIPITAPMLHGLEVRGIDAVFVEKSDRRKLRQPRISPCAVSCSLCSTPLPLKLADLSEISANWACVSCNSVYHGHLDVNNSVQHSANVRIKRFQIDRQQLLPPAASLAKVVQELVPEPYEGPERRASPRKPIIIPVPVVPVDESFEPIGPAFMMTTQNISTGGIAMVHNAPMRPKRLIIELPSRSDRAPTQVAMEVLRCRQMGSVYEVAGKFIMRAVD